jgi:Protein of unknown function (DUF2892)
MSERFFRIILGSLLLLFLFLGSRELTLAYIGLLLFEGITNWRIPILVSKARYGADYQQAVQSCGGTSTLNFDAERALRLIVAALLFISYVILGEMAWFFPWFIGVMLLIAGLTNICPMVMTLRLIGFR